MPKFTVTGKFDLRDADGDILEKGATVTAADFQEGADMDYLLSTGALSADGTTTGAAKNPNSEPRAATPSPSAEPARRRGRPAKTTDAPAGQNEATADDDDDPDAEA